MLSASPESDRLSALANHANDAHARAGDAVVSALRHALEAGRALSEAQALVPYGEWERWLAEHFRGSPRSARRWMRLYRERERLPGGDPLRTGVSELTPSQALAMLAAREEPAEATELTPDQVARFHECEATIRSSMITGAAAWRAAARLAREVPDGEARLRAVVASRRVGPPLPVTREELATAMATWSLADLVARLLQANDGQPRLCARIMLAIESRGLYRPRFGTLDEWRDECGWAGKSYDQGLAWARSNPDTPAERPRSEADCCRGAWMLLRMAWEEPAAPEPGGERPTADDKRAFNTSLDACMLLGAATGRAWTGCLELVALAHPEYERREVGPA